MLTPYLTVKDARAAIDWYRSAFGARVSFEPIVMDDGRIGHVELTIGTEGRFMLSDEFDSAGVAAPDPARGNAVSLHIDTPAVDVVVEQAKSLGAQIDRVPEETPHGRVAVLHDPFGHRWFLNQASISAG